MTRRDKKKKFLKRNEKSESQNNSFLQRTRQEHVCQLMLRTRTLGHYTKKTQKEKTIYSAKYFELLTKKKWRLLNYDHLPSSCGKSGVTSWA